jgi:hypothetical protein
MVFVHCAPPGRGIVPTILLSGLRGYVPTLAHRDQSLQVEKGRDFVTMGSTLSVALAWLTLTPCTHPVWLPEASLI